jgi:hypothetical protein
MIKINIIHILSFLYTNAISFTAFIIISEFIVSTFSIAPIVNALSIIKFNFLIEPSQQFAIAT